MRVHRPLRVLLPLRYRALPALLRLRYRVTIPSCFATRTNCKPTAKEKNQKLESRFRFPKKPTRVAAPSPRASLGRRTVCGRTEQRRPPISKRYETKVRMGVWGRFLIAAAALKTPTRNGYDAQGANLTFPGIEFRVNSPNSPASPLGLHKIFVRSKAVLHYPNILVFPLPSALLTLLQY